MKPLRKAVRCVLIENGKIVITKYLKGNKIGYYDIPGGKIELGETPEEAAIREMKEEKLKIEDKADAKRKLRKHQPL